jgi:hypothetical protein
MSLTCDGFKHRFRALRILWYNISKMRRLDGEAGDYVIHENYHDSRG